MTLTKFQKKKQEILRLLSEPDYDDASPKGSVDAEIRDFIEEINSIESLVTTSSCSGRISVFLEGQKAVAKSVGEVNTNDTEERQEYASQGGKGGGGRWLYVSHQPLSASDDHKNATSLMSLFKMQTTESQLLSSTTGRFVHLKFEPMILHILIATLPEAQKVLAAAQQAGFRESGISSVQGEGGPVIVAVRTTGLAFDNIVGILDEQTEKDTIAALVDEQYLQILVEMINDKFSVNVERTQRFRKLLLDAFNKEVKDDGWENADVRRRRKREEGLRRREELRRLEMSRRQAEPQDDDDNDTAGINSDRT